MNNKSILVECSIDLPLSRFVDFVTVLDSLIKNGNEIILTGSLVTLRGVVAALDKKDDSNYNIRCYVPYDCDHKDTEILKNYLSDNFVVVWEAGGHSKVTGLRERNCFKRAVKSCDCFIGFTNGPDIRVSSLTRLAHSMNRPVYINADIDRSLRPLSLATIKGTRWEASDERIVDNDEVFWSLADLAPTPITSTVTA